MKLSIEAKVAAAVAASFIALTAATISQGGSAGQNGGADNNSVAESFRVETRVREQAYGSPLPGDTDAEDNIRTISEEGTTGTTAKKHTASRIGKSGRHHPAQRNRGSR